MFPKFPAGRHPFSPHFPLREPEHEDASSSGAAPAAPSAAPLDRPSTGDGASIEVVRRPRGRPPGSKNKSKPPVVISRDAPQAEPAMNPCVLELPAGNDIIEAISRFCRRKGIGLCILSGTGTVADFTILQPASTPGATVTFHGRFEILSISATFLPNSMPFQVPNAFKISLVGPQGQVLGGAVVGPLIAAGPVFVIAATFNSPAFQRLPLGDEEMNSSVSGSGSRADGQSPPVSGSGDHGGPPQATAESYGMPMYNAGHMGSSDVIWPPTARPRQPPPPY